MYLLVYLNKNTYKCTYFIIKLSFHSQLISLGAKLVLELQLL